MKLKNIHKTAGQQVQDWAVENQRLQGNKEDLEANLVLKSKAFDWNETKQGYMFWSYVEDEMTEQELQEKYPEILKTPKEIAQNILKGVSYEVLEEIRKELGTN